MLRRAAKRRRPKNTWRRDLEETSKKLDTAEEDIFVEDQDRLPGGIMLASHAL